MTKRRLIIWTIILTWLGLGSLLSVVVDWQWFSSVGYLGFSKQVDDADWIVAPIFWCEFYLYLLADWLAARSERFKAIYIEDHFEIELSEEGWAAVFQRHSIWPCLYCRRFRLGVLPPISGCMVWRSWIQLISIRAIRSFSGF